jgi:hypothetical protein
MAGAYNQSSNLLINTIARNNIEMEEWIVDEPNSFPFNNHNLLHIPLIFVMCALLKNCHHGT